MEVNAGLIPPYELDPFSNVAIINLEYDITHYLEVPDASNRYRIIVGILESVFSNVPEEIGLEGNTIVEILEEMKL